MTRKICILFLIGLIFLYGCKAKPPALQEAGTAVTVTQPAQRLAADHLDLVGNTQAVNTVQLVARVAGYLEKAYFQDGQVVKEGDPLFLIEQDTYQAKIKQAQGQVASLKALAEYANSQFARYQNLVAQNAAAQADADNWRYQRDAAEANLKTAEANLDLAKLDLSYTQITAPFAGRIDRRLQDPGNMVGVGQNTVLAQLTQIDPIYVYFTISDTDLARMTKTQRNSQRKVYIGLVGEEGFPHEGTVDFTSTTLSQTTGSLLERAVIANPGGAILPGAYARVSLPLEETNVLLVPQESVSEDQLGSYLFVVNSDNIVERRNVKTGFILGNQQVIERGLSINESVITNGLIKVRAGLKVNPKIGRPEAKVEE